MCGHWTTGVFVDPLCNKKENEVKKTGFSSKCVDIFITGYRWDKSLDVSWLIA